MSDFYTGTIIDYGEAPYQFNKKEGKSYFVSISDAEDGQEIKTLWGIDLQRALVESGAGRGDVVSLAFLGKQPVTVPVTKGEGPNQRIEYVETHRNAWEIEVLQKKQDEDPSDTDSEKSEDKQDNDKAPQNKNADSQDDKQSPPQNNHVAQGPTGQPQAIHAGPGGFSPFSSMKREEKIPVDGGVPEKQASVFSYRVTRANDNNKRLDSEMDTALAAYSSIQQHAGVRQILERGDIEGGKKLFDTLVKRDPELKKDVEVLQQSFATIKTDMEENLRKNDRAEMSVEERGDKFKEFNETLESSRLSDLIDEDPKREQSLREAVQKLSKELMKILKELIKDFKEGLKGLAMPGPKM